MEKGGRTSGRMAPWTIHKQRWRLVSESKHALIKTLSSCPITSFQQMRGESSSFLDPRSGAGAYWTERACGGVEKACLFMHPPYNGGTGFSTAVFDDIELPTGAPVALRCAIGKADGSTPGDGILFRVIVVDAQGQETVVAEKIHTQHAWAPLTVDLGRWSGQSIRLKLIADAGPRDDPGGDWACWADLRLETLQPVVETVVEPAP